MEAAAPCDTSDHVLIVDDDPAIGALIAEVLGRAGCETMIASSCDEALATARQWRVDLVISDVVLGVGGDGIDCVERVKTLQPRAETLFMSGYARPRAPSGGDSLLAKPFGVDDLLVRVQSLLLERRQASVRQVPAPTVGLRYSM